jgi:hypothetical protein
LWSEGGNKWLNPDSEEYEVVTAVTAKKYLNFFLNIFGNGGSIKLKEAISIDS